MRFTIVLLVAASCYSQIDSARPLRPAPNGTLRVGIAGTTNTQAVLTYPAPDGDVCTVKVSQQASLMPLVHDVDPALFPGSDHDSRPGTITAQTSRIFVVGKRIAQRASDGKNYSRALEAYAAHYYQVTCGSTVATGSFTTTNIPLGMTFQDIPQLDPANPGSSIMPTLVNDRTQTIVDPHTGALIRRVSLPADTGYDTDPTNPGRSGPYMYFGGFTRVCSNQLMGSPAVGNLCSFPEGGGGYGVLYSIIPSTGEARFLGTNFGVAYAYINPTDGKFYNMSGGDLIQYTYSGNYSAASPGSTASFSHNTILSGVSTAIHTFNSAFVVADFGCGPGTAMGDYIAITCKRGNQDTYGWVAVVRLSTGRVIAAAQVYNNIQCRWCGLHAVFPMYDQPVLAITTHGLVDGNGLGGGAYLSTYTGGGTLASNTLTIPVSGEPACGSCGTDTDVPLAQVGDVFQFADGGGERVRITTKSSPTSWTVARGVNGTTAATHASGAALNAACTYTPIYWRFLADPNGTDATNTNFVADAYWPIGGHDDMTTGLRLTESTGYPIVVGDLAGSINTPITRTINSSPLFAGTLAQCYGDACTAHPSASAAQPWFTDYFTWSWAGSQGTITSVSGQLYKYPNTYFPLNPKYFSIAGAVGTHASSSLHSLLDVSPTLLGTGSGDNYKYCVANAAGECYSGSAKGEVYVNLPSLPNTSACGGNTGVCLGNFGGYANGVLQIGVSGAVRVISNGLAALRDTNDYPTAKALADGSYVLFTVGDTEYSKPSQVLMAKLPPLGKQDEVDRSTFVRARIPLAAPQGQGVASAAIEFGYTEQGEPSQYYCTSRRESCVAVAATVNDATPFYYAQTETYTRMPCAKSCTITLPVLPAHVAYFQVKFYDAQGVLVGLGDRGVAVEGTATKAGEGSANANQY